MSNMKKHIPIERIGGKSRRDDTLLTVGFNLRKQKHTTQPVKSRRDDTLLTVGFNLRNTDAARHVSTSPAGTTLALNSINYDIL